MSPVDFADFEALKAAVGTEIGVSEWITIDQGRIDTFADATDDHQWIHVDAERAAAGPYGKTIAHGFLTLSLIVPMTAQVLKVSCARMAINYGLDRVRFITPVTVGSRIRGRVTLDTVTDIPGGVQTERTVTVEIEGAAKPACVAVGIARYLA
ncbi:MaoC family dehydratase [Nocardia huaxiensis]|uniref:MaoC family dehydratase n=1 Tax=Nocardia huaxiensis TaxID=2755382 RepID=A0A7D6ZGZ4_9NOCA|nr:MaoC family dehydratase [Nocardia huaxiensis]QLY33558.1 MaoC family dehydratase [Nocardia huaxiensis]UFS99525.1 MaoC family dehydratase [Nocardia huaxiensis]